MNRRNVLFPWLIGLSLIALVDLFVAYRMFATDCPAPALAEFLVVALIPGIYLFLMYLTLKSQNGK